VSPFGIWLNISMYILVKLRMQVKQVNYVCKMISSNDPRTWKRFVNSSCVGEGGRRGSRGGAADVESSSLISRSKTKRGSSKLPSNS